MNKDNTIKQCILIGQSIHSDYASNSIFVKVGVTPAIDYCINWLCDNGIKEIFLFYSKSKSEVEEYVRSRSSTRSDCKIDLNYVKSEDFKDFGDAMREVQFRSIVSQDFLVVFADMICNVDLKKAADTHFRKKAELKNVVLTSVLRDNSYDGKIHVTSSEGEILQMDEDKGSKFKLNGQRIKLKKMNVEFRRDLSHCEIYICTVEVLKNFKQNYEYTSMFQYINGMLTSEVYEEKILGYILPSHQFSYRLNRSKDYYLAYQHYIADHFYPYVLQKRLRNNSKQEQRYVSKNFNKVLHSSVSVPRTAFLSNNCFVGEKTVIGNNTDIEKSIIGSGCQISNQVSIKNCLILDGCVIAEKASFENCLIEKVNETQQIRRFSLGSCYRDEIVTEPLFEETPPPEESTFEEELQQVVAEEPRIEIINELNSIRKHHNKSLQEFTKEIIRMVSPQGIKGVEHFSKGWGPILLKIHENQSLLIDSIFYSCTNIPAYDKAFHVFLQFFFKFDSIKDFVIQSWYTEAIAKDPASPALLKCENFIKMLKQQEDDQSDEGSSEESGSKKAAQNSDSEND